MPLHRSVSPLSLETCSTSSTDLESDGIIGSDDELDEAGRAAQRQRIEKLAETYLHGKPLFILSASLRGPFEKSWENPWRKIRRSNVSTEHNKRRILREAGRVDSPVIQETNPRKRRQHHSSQDNRLSQLSSTRSGSNVSISGSKKGFSRDASRLPNPPRDTPASASPVTPRSKLTAKTTESQAQQLYRSTPIRNTDESWLRKDRAHIGFNNVDPPTSPTTKVSSRHQQTKNRPAILAPVKSQPPATDPDHREVMPAYRANPSLPRAHTVDGPNVDRISNRINSPTPSKLYMSHSSARNATSDATIQEKSFSVLSSSSHLPQFEYRRKMYRPASDKGRSESPRPALNEQQRSMSPSHTLEVSMNPDEQDEQDGQAPEPQKELSPDTTKHDHLEIEQDAQPSVDLAHALNFVEVTSSSHPGKVQSTNIPPQGTTSEKLPSAQPVRPNPTVSDYLTSLHTITNPKDNSEYDGDTIPDPQFSTQAALLLAQKSFQNDLDSQDLDLATPEKKRRASQISNHGSSPTNNITPFYRLSTPNAHGGNTRPKVHGTAKRNLMSTQCIIDAVTPFTFSTEKKPNRHLRHSPNNGSSSKKPRTAGFVESSSPSARYSDACSEPQRIPDSMPHYQTYRADTQHSALPMTLTGTTPPTAQDGQADSFNLSQAIAEAGSWLQQSFDINKDLNQCRNPRAVPDSSNEARRSELGVDIN